MYVSPINIVTKEASIQLDNLIKDEIAKITQKYYIDINEKELIAALQADRQRYEDAWRFGYREGYRQGKNDAAQEEVTT